MQVCLFPTCVPVWCRSDGTHVWLSSKLRLRDPGFFHFMFTSSSTYSVCKCCSMGIEGVLRFLRGLHWWLSGKESSFNARATGDVGSIPGPRRFPGGGHATYSSILAWRIPWTEELGRLQSLGSQRVRHDWGDSTNAPRFVKEISMGITGNSMCIISAYIILPRLQ